MDDESWDNDFTSTAQTTSTNESTETNNNSSQIKVNIFF